MRPLLHGDVSDAARALYAAPAAARARLCRRLIAEADAAERHMECTGRLHPDWGNGSLMAAARQRPLPPEPGLDDPDYCRCMELVLSCLIEHLAGAGTPAAGKARGPHGAVRLR
ncbi:MAG: DUF7742 family protein [Marinibacterium sp.]